MIITGYTGYTIDNYPGSDNKGGIYPHGDVDRCLIGFTYPARLNDVEFEISEEQGDWGAYMPNGEIIPLSTPEVLFHSRDNAVVQFDMNVRYPSNSPVFLVNLHGNGSWTITEKPNRTFKPTTITANFGFTTHGDGRTIPYPHGDVDTVRFSIPYARRPNKVDFDITPNIGHWGARMGNGELIDLTSPIVQTTPDMAIVNFKMNSRYPSESPCLLVRKVQEAAYTIREIPSDQVQAANVKGISGIPSTIFVGERVTLLSIIFDPPDASNKRIDWRIVDAGSTNIKIQNNKIYCSNVGTFVIRATITNKDGSVYTKDFIVTAIKTDLTIKKQPEAVTTVTFNEIKEALTVYANVTIGKINYQWYSNATNTNIGGTPISGQDKKFFKLPTNLQPGDYYFFCEISGDETIGSRRTNVATIRVRRKLNGISITPNNNFLAPGETRRYYYHTDPPDTDELYTYSWNSSRDEIISIDQQGNATAHNNGTATISVYHNESNKQVMTAIDITTTFVPIQKITLNLNNSNALEIGEAYPLTAAITPTNATYSAIVWEVVDAGTTGARINNNILRVSEAGIVTIRARVEKGISLQNSYTQDFSFTVQKRFEPVTSINLLNDIGNLYPGNLLVLRSNVIPVNATNSVCTWSIVSGSDKATLSGNILTLNAQGIVTLRATVLNGATATTNYTKDFTINIEPKFVPVQSISIPLSIDCSNNNGRVPSNTNLDCTVSPSNATKQNISLTDPKVITETGQTVAGVTARITTDNQSTKTLTVSSLSLTYESNLYVKITAIVADGISPGVPFTSVHNVYLIPPKKTGFIPLTGIEFDLPMKMRAYRPFIIGKFKTVTPPGASVADDPTFVVYNDAINGASIPSDGNNYSGVIPNGPMRPRAYGFLFNPQTPGEKEIYGNFGVIFESKYNWTHDSHYGYLFNKGYFRIKLTYENAGVEITPTYPNTDVEHEDFEQFYTFYVDDPYIPVVGINNIPETIVAGTEYILSPEIDVGDGFNPGNGYIHANILWDNDKATYETINWTIYDIIPNTAIVNLNGNILKATTPCSFKLKATIEQGLVEEGSVEDHIWNNNSYHYTARPYTKDFPTITVTEAETSNPDPYLILTLTQNRTVSIYKKSEIEQLKSTSEPASTLSIEVNGQGIKKNEITGIKFMNAFDLDNLTNFARNCTALTTLSREGDPPNSHFTIPDSVKGKNCLRNFLMGCTSFNQQIIIPISVVQSGNNNMERAFEGFLRDCRSFNQPITLPNIDNIDNIGTQNRMLESFLRGCTSFNQSITLPKKCYGERFLYSFMRGCTLFNSEITLPTDVVSGRKIMEDFLRDCTAFNQPIILPTAISGAYNTVGFMHECRAMQSIINVPNVNCAAAMSQEEHVLSSYTKINCALVNTGPLITGAGAAKFKTQIGGNLPPPPEPGEPEDENYVPYRKLR
jgi:hypothetical protein